MNYEQRLDSLIPGGAHTYSRGKDQFPSNAPKILVSGRGAYVVKVGGDKLLDYGMGLRSVVLGYGNRRVNRGAIRGMKLGTNLTKPALLELEAAELLAQQVPTMEMLKFTKNGSTAVTAAVKLARGFTGRNKILICKQHPFFSFDDWFIGTTAMNKGVPDAVRNMSLTFDYGDLESVENAFLAHEGEIAAVLLEPATDVGPSFSKNTFDPSERNFLTKLAEVTRSNGALLIVDEMITGFRGRFGAMADIYSVRPDLTTFGKAIGNGFPIAAVGGRREIMEQGSILQEGRERLFLLSTTHGSELVSLGALIETLHEMLRTSHHLHLCEFGQSLINSANEIAKAHGVSDQFEVYGNASSPYYRTLDQAGQPSLEFRTLFQQEMINQGVLMPWIALSTSHSNRELAKTESALDKALSTYKRALAEGVQNLLKGPTIKPVFRRFN